MTKEDYSEWINSKILTERSINTAKKLKNHWSKEDQEAFINQLAIINWVLESTFIKDKTK
jgi:hypothetical protein